MSKVELIGKQENGRDAMVAFTLEDYPKSVEEWIVEANKRGVNFDENVTREKGVHLGQFTLSGGYVKAGDTLEEFDTARKKIQEIAERSKVSNLSSVEMALSLAKNSLGYDTETWRKAKKVYVKGPHGTDRAAFMKKVYDNSVDANLKQAIDWSKAELPKSNDKNLKQTLVQLPGDKTLWLVIVSG